MISAPQQDLQELWSLLHFAPLAMIQTDSGGNLRKTNARAIQLLMPLASSQGLPGDNVLKTLEGCLPQITHAVASFAPESGTIIAQELHHLPPPLGDSGSGRHLCVTIEKPAPDNLLFFIEDLTEILGNFAKRGAAV